MFDSAEIRIRYDNLTRLLEEENAVDLLYLLNEGIHGNMAGMGKPVLYSQAKSGTKVLIDDYVKGLVNALNFIAEADHATVPFEEKLDFFRRASHCYGRSALMLSGGAGLVYFHHGTVEELVEQQSSDKQIDIESVDISGVLSRSSVQEIVDAATRAAKDNK